MADRLEAAARINEMIASAIRANAQWFWKNVRNDELGRGSDSGGQAG